MKTTTRLTTALLATLAPTANALAATGARTDTSGIYVWAFLGLCALIVALQVVPAVLMAIGAAKGITEGLRERHMAKVEEKART